MQLTLSIDPNCGKILLGTNSRLCIGPKSVSVPCAYCPAGSTAPETLTITPSGYQVCSYYDRCENTTMPPMYWPPHSVLYYGFDASTINKPFVLNRTAACKWEIETSASGGGYQLFMHTGECDEEGEAVKYGDMLLSGIKITMIRSSSIEFHVTYIFTGTINGEPVEHVRNGTLGSIILNGTVTDCFNSTNMTFQSPECGGWNFFYGGQVAIDD